jgi:hypothetical protein
MLDAIKKMAMEKGMSLMESEKVAKVLSNETVGAIVEKAMTVPFKISNAIASQKEKLVSMLDLATQEDIDDIRRTMTRVEDVLQEIKKESGDLIEKIEGRKKPK